MERNKNKFINMKFYKGKIEDLKTNQVFCFGSNKLGINGNPIKGTGGSALFALNNGWVEQGEKLDNKLSKSEKAWGIVTVSYPGKKQSIPIKTIAKNIKILYDFANLNPEKEFLIAYTKSGRNLNGWSSSDMAWAFSQNDIPNNIIFEESFYELIKIFKDAEKDRNF